MDWFTLFCYSLCTAMLTLTVLGLGVSVFMPGMNRWNRRFFTALFTVLLLLMGSKEHALPPSNRFVGYILHPVGNCPVYDLPVLRYTG